MKFLLDENLPAWLAADMRTAGLDAVDIRVVARPGLTDDEVYAFARRERRHIVSANYKDFGNPLLFPPTASTGIIVIRMPKCSVQTVAAHVLRYLEGVKQAEVVGVLTILEPTRVRRKKLS